MGEVLSVMRDLVKGGMTCIILTHEMSFAREASTRVMFMDEGHIKEQGSPEQLFGQPQSARTQSFLSKVLR